MAKVYNLNKQETYVGSVSVGECFYWNGIPYMRISGYDVEKGYVPVVRLETGAIDTLGELALIDNYIVYNAIGLNVCAEEMNNY